MSLTYPQEVEQEIAKETTSLDLEACFNEANSEHCKFERIENPLSKRKDLCAFLKLDQLLPGDYPILACSEHDEIFLNISCDELAPIATKEDIIYLSRCGVRYSSRYDSLCMFV